MFKDNKKSLNHQRSFIINLQLKSSIKANHNCRFSQITLIKNPT